MENIITDTRPQMWNSDEIRELIIYAKDLQQQVDDKNAQLIMMNAALEREQAKVRRLTLTLKQFMNI
jgi:hypothetical protein